MPHLSPPRQSSSLHRAPMYAPLVLLSFVLPALAGIQELWWNVTYVQDQNPDGLFPRRVIGVNDTWP